MFCECWDICFVLLGLSVRLRYDLQRTLDVGIIFIGTTLNLHAFYSADWAGNLDSRRSSTGYVLYATEGPILRSFKLQFTVKAFTIGRKIHGGVPCYYPRMCVNQGDVGWNGFNDWRDHASHGLQECNLLGKKSTIPQAWQTYRY